MKKMFFYLIVLVFLCELACTPKPLPVKKMSTKGYPQRLIDATGKEVVIAKKPQRIISCSSMYTQIIIDLGCANCLVGVAKSSDNPQEVAQLPKIGKSLALNLEKIVALQPDLVFAAFGSSRPQIEQANIPVFLCGKPKTALIDSIEEIYKTIRTIALIVQGNTKKADIVIGEIQANIDNVQHVLKNSTPITAAVLYLSRGKAPYVQGKDSLPGQILSMVKGKNVFSEIHSGSLSLEKLIEQNPEVIITDPIQVELVVNNRHLRQLRAVKNHKVYGVKASLWTSSRISEAVKAVAVCLHPEAF